MKRSLLFVGIALSSFMYCQKHLKLDETALKKSTKFFVDDYREIYLYNENDLVLTKYDSIGKQRGQIRLTTPYKIQNVQNPFNTVLFSENAQNIKLVDQYLNETQIIDLRKIGYSKMIYSEDLQQIWILEDSMKKLVQYNYRDDKIISSHAMYFSFNGIRDMMVFDGKIYLLFQDELSVYDFKSKLLFSSKLNQPIKFRRENDLVYIICKNEIHRLLPNLDLKSIFKSSESQNVDKNSVSYFEVKDNKVYLYPIQ